MASVTAITRMKNGADQRLREPHRFAVFALVSQAGWMEIFGMEVADDNATIRLQLSKDGRDQLVIVPDALLGVRAKDHG